MSTTIEDVLCAIVAHYLHERPITPETRLDDLAIDSLGLVMIVEQLERAIPDDRMGDIIDELADRDPKDAPNWQTVGDLAQHFESQLAV